MLHRADPAETWIRVSTGTTFVRIRYDEGKWWITINHHDGQTTFVREDSIWTALIRLGFVLGKIYVESNADEKAEEEKSGSKTTG